MNGLRTIIIGCKKTGIMNERRQYERFSISYPIIYVVVNDSGQVETQGIGLALDISMDGMMFESSEPIEATQLSIHASRTDGGTLKVDALLVYSMPHVQGKYRSGIRFTGDPDPIARFFVTLRHDPP